MDKSGANSFSESYSELMKKEHTQNGPSEKADVKRKLLLLTSHESTKTLDTKSASLVYEKNFQAYNKSTSNGKLYEDKQLKPEDKAAKFQSNLRNNNSLAGLLKRVIIKSTSLETEQSNLTQVFNKKSDYIAGSVMNKNKKYINPLCDKTKISGAKNIVSGGDKVEKVEGSRLMDSSAPTKKQLIDTLATNKYSYNDNQSGLINSKDILKKGNQFKISSEDFSMKYENKNIGCDNVIKYETEKQNYKTSMNLENRVNTFKPNVSSGSKNDFCKASEIFGNNDKPKESFCNKFNSNENFGNKISKSNENSIPLKQISTIDDVEISEGNKNKYTFKKYNYKGNNENDEDDEEGFKQKKKCFSRNNSDDYFKKSSRDDFTATKRKYNNPFNKKDADDDDEDSFNKKNKFGRKNNTNEEDEDDPNSYYNKKKRNAELYKRRFKKMEEEEEQIRKAPIGGFKTAREEFNLQYMKKHGTNAPGMNPANKKTLGLRGPSSKFISPLIQRTNSEESMKDEDNSEPVDERLKNIDPKMVELIKSEIMDFGPKIDWNDIAGLQFAKTAIQEAVVWPMLRPDIFTGLRRPPKGILLFGPPGTGKTLIGKCVASQSQSTFFSISASSLTSKWIGDGEKMVRALFAVARCHQPAVIFIDEIDSLLSQRSDSEHESSRRIKTEFLVQLDGATTDNEERLLLIGATNRPQELDEAARRRFVKRLYIPLPEYEARLQLVERLMSKEKHCLDENNINEIATLSNGYSGADMRNLCADACMGPIRSIDITQIQNIQAQEVRPVSMEDFTKSLNRMRPSVSEKDLDQYLVWDKTYGSGAF